MWLIFFTKPLPVHKFQQLKNMLVSSPSDHTNMALNSRARSRQKYIHKKREQEKNMNTVGVVDVDHSCIPNIIKGGDDEDDDEEVEVERSREGELRTAGLPICGDEDTSTL